MTTNLNESKVNQVSESKVNQVSEIIFEVPSNKREIAFYLEKIINKDNNNELDNLGLIINLLQIMRKHSAYIAGSCALALTQLPNPMFEPNDIDVFVSTGEIYDVKKELSALLDTKFVKLKSGYGATSANGYMNTYYNSEIACVYEGKIGCKRLQLVVIANKRHRDFYKWFDIDICQCCYDGNKLLSMSPRGTMKFNAKIFNKTKPDEIANENRRVQTRISKYISRGFTPVSVSLTLFRFSPDIISTMPIDKDKIAEITIENMISKLKA